MMSDNTTGDAGRVGFTCAYTPLPLIDAAGLVPHRLLPVGEAPDQAGALLHDNLCPHVKRVLDRAMAGDLPPLAGAVLVNSCDAMRRLADAWRVVLPRDPVFVLDLPIAADGGLEGYLAVQLERLRHALGSWAGRAVTDEQLHASVERYEQLATALERHRRLTAAGVLPGGRRRHQQLLNRSVTAPAAALLRELLDQLGGVEDRASPAGAGGVPLFLFGNVLPDPAAYELFEACGAAVIGDDLCTGTRQLVPGAALDRGAPPLPQLARQLLGRPSCARTLRADAPGHLAEQVAASARASGARGVIAHVMKFCDPYLARLPEVRQRLKQEGLPLLILEGDCTLRSLGQHRTRIEAFVELLA